MVEEGGKALAAYLKPREEGKIQPGPSDEIADMVKTLGEVRNTGCRIRTRAVELQSRLGRAYLDLWGAAAKRLSGEDAEPVVAPDPRDRRFADPEWSSNQFFDFVKQAYLLSTQWADELVEDAQGPRPAHAAEGRVLRPADRQRAVAVELRADQSRAAARDPRLQRGKSRARHAMLAEDIEAGGGDLKIRQSDAEKFEVGRNLAVTPGKVIFQNKLMQLIQYAPSTPTVLKTPLLIVPPWINKFYVLDLTPEKSFIKWCVDQGLTVFVISWVNPDERLANKGFEDYMRAGPARRARRDQAGDRREQGPRHRLLRRRHAARRSRSPTWRRRATTGSHRRRCSPRRSISPTRATSRCSSTRSSSRRWNGGWPSAAISKAGRWPTPSTCCAPTT